MHLKQLLGENHFTKHIYQWKWKSELNSPNQELEKEKCKPK